MTKKSGEIRCRYCSAPVMVGSTCCEQHQDILQQDEPTTYGYGPNVPEVDKS